MELISLKLLLDRIQRQIALEYSDKDDVYIVFGKMERIEKLEDQNYAMQLTKLFGYNVEFGDFNYGFLLRKRNNSHKIQFLKQCIYMENYKNKWKYEDEERPNGRCYDCRVKYSEFPDFNIPIQY